MSKDKFEQLIEYVINDNEQQARELFHQIVVEKSRSIYESLMDEEELEEAKEEDLDEAKDEEDLEEAEDLDEAKDEEDLEEGMGDGDDAMGRMDTESIGGDASESLMHDVEMDETGLGEEEDDEVQSPEEAGDLEDRVANLEDEVDQLMAEFEEILSGHSDMDSDEVGGDAEEVDDTAEFGSEEDVEELGEAINLKAAPAPVKSEEAGINKKAVVAANAGAKGPIGNSVKPVHTGGEGGGKHDASGAYSNQTKDLIGTVGNSPAQSTQKLKPANKPHLAQASGVNTKSVTH